MFPDNPEINEMITAMKSGFEDQQQSEMKQESKTLFRKSFNKNNSSINNNNKNIEKISSSHRNINIEKKEEKSIF